ncbi:MAG: hypothetical protein U9Q81_12695 [Pseudomonadota bacterium]|nr:hypothetical protein [Pseudomonadota bacterium]
MASRKGIPNKRTAGLLEEVRRAYPDYDPVIELIKIARDPEATRAEQIQCHKEAAKYLRRQLKAIEVSGDPERPVAMINTEPMSPEEWDKKYCEPNP